MRIPCTLIKLGQSKAASSFLCVAALLLASVPQTKAAFSIPAPLVSTPTDSSDQQVATSGNNVYVVWKDNEIGATSLSPEIYFVRSTNGGLTFEAPQNLSQSSGTPGNPRIAASGQHVYITFNEGVSSFLVHSEDGGMSFLPKTNLIDSGIYLGAAGWLAASGTNLYMVWRQSTAGADDIYLARFGSNGTSFLGSQNVSISPAPAHSIDPVVTASGNSVYVAWSEPVTGNSNDIIFRRSTDGGVAFDAPINVSNNTGLSRFPAMTADGTKVWLAWTDKTPLNDDIFLARSVDGGSLFEPKVNLSNTATNSADPTVTAKGSAVYVAWSDLPAGVTTGNLRDIFLATSADFGSTFDPASVKNVSETATALSGVPRIAATDPLLSVYWGESLQAGMGTQRDIFFSSQELAIPVPPPSMLSLTPGAGMQTQSVDVDLTGSGFQSGATLALSGTGVTVTDVQFVSPSAMKAKMNVALTAAPGGRDLTVVNPDNKSATLSGAFAVVSASALRLIDIARTDVTMGAGNGGFLAASSSNGKEGANSSYKSLLAHLDNAEKALLQQPPDAAIAINQMDAFYIKIGNLAKGKKPEITTALYTTLYNDYAMVMGNLGGTVKPAH